jgi:hypothetical protein
MKKWAERKKCLTKNRHPDYYADTTAKRCRPRKCGILQDEGVQREIGRLFFFRAIVLIEKSCPPTARGEEEDEGVRGEKPGRFFFCYGREGGAETIFLKEENKDVLQQT